MLVVDQVIVSSEVIEEAFVCDLLKCKGACCIEGDSGAPLESEEIEQINQNLKGIAAFLTSKSIHEIKRQGVAVHDKDGDLATPTHEGKECVYAVYDTQGILKCGIEQAWKAGRSTFRKPVSCHLYPIRIKKLFGFDALNYHRWQICSPACEQGKELKVPIYRFLKEALVRLYGEEWYKKLESSIHSNSTSSIAHSKGHL